MGAKGRLSNDNKSSPKVEVGEIDTRAPFQSVKDAVSLFGEGAFSGEKPAIRKPKQPQSAERVFAKETQLQLAQKELNKLQDQLNNAETTKSQALVELEKAKRTVEDLTQKLNVFSFSKESALKAIEASRVQAKQVEEANNFRGGFDGFKQEDLDNAREKYITATAQLDDAKKELRRIRQDRNLLLETKATAAKQVAEAELTVQLNTAKASEISNEITHLRESLVQVKLATSHSIEEQEKIFTEKDIRKQAYKASLEESAKKLASLKNEYDPELAKTFESKLANTLTEIGSLQEEIEKAKTADVTIVKEVTLELDDAKESLYKVVEEETSLRNLMESLKKELENVKKEHLEIQQKESETENIADNLQEKLIAAKLELEGALAAESKVKGASEEMISTINQILSESLTMRGESEEMKKKAEELHLVAEATRKRLQETEVQLVAALAEVEEAKAAEERALDQIKVLSEQASAARASASESGAQITISKEEFDSLSGKTEESNRLTEMRVAAAMAQVEAVKASENEAVQKLELMAKEIEETKALTVEALKKAEMAEAAKKAVEGELRRWREREQKKAAEAASRILAETTVAPSPLHSPKSSPQAQHQVVGGGGGKKKKLEKSKTSVSRKVLVSNLSGVFYRKKKQQVESGSPSFLPGEKPF